MKRPDGGDLKENNRDVMEIFYGDMVWTYGVEIWHGDTLRRHVDSSK